MSKRKVLPLPVPSVEIEFAGQIYPLAFTFGALVTAKRELAKIGVQANFLSGFNFAEMEIECMVPLIYAAIQGGGSDLSLEDVGALIEGSNAYVCYAKILEAWSAAVSPVEKSAKNGSADAE